MPKIGHLCFPIAFFGHFQYTLTDQERIPHSPSGGDFHGKIEYINDTPLGVLLLELSGDEEEVERAIRYMAERTKGVEVIDRAA
ncbi:NIL domain-containing protein [Geobacillus sp. FW23]|uniref:NIL domain-containing protein n=1 Tax=Geobacillus sp. FW23 TaxID=1048208 RepID=UPI000467F590